MALPMNVMHEIFTRLSVRYGSKFAASYAPHSLEVVSDDWAEFLDGVSANSIQYALVNLPLEWPPNVMQFRDLCMRMPDPYKHSLPMPKQDKERAEATRKRIAADMAKLTAKLNAPRGPLDWAHALKAREESGDRLTQAQRSMWHEAFSQTHITQLSAGDFTAIENHTLPPAMQR